MHSARRRGSSAADSLAHVCFQPGIRRIEGVNHTIGIAKRLPGSCDNAHFFLKIRAAFAGVGR
jgi:hypothetical protein